MKGCLQTNYGDVVKFIAVPSFTCVHVWLVHVHYINMHVPLFFDVVFTQVHCLPTNYDDIVVTTLLEAQETSSDSDMHNTVLVPLLYFMNSGCVLECRETPTSWVTI